MIPPTLPGLSPLSTFPRSVSLTPARREDGSRPVVSMAAPVGSTAQLRIHYSLVSSAEREFGHLLARIDDLLQPVV